MKPAAVAAPPVNDLRRPSASRDGWRRQFEDLASPARRDRGRGVEIARSIENHVRGGCRSVGIEGTEGEKHRFLPGIPCVAGGDS